PRSSGCGGSRSWKTENFRLDEPALRTRSAAATGPVSVGPGPVDDLRTVDAVLVCVTQVVEDGVLHLLLQMCPLRAELRHPIDDVDDQVEPRDLVEHRELQRRVDVASLLVAADVE